jgi:hypothetical protein
MIKGHITLYLTWRKGLTTIFPEIYVIALPGYFLSIIAKIFIINRMVIKVDLTRAKHFFLFLVLYRFLHWNKFQKSYIDYACSFT